MGTELGRMVELHEEVELHLFKITSWDYKEEIYLTWFSIKKHQTNKNILKHIFSSTESAEYQSIAVYREQNCWNGPVLKGIWSGNSTFASGRACI